MSRLLSWQWFWEGHVSLKTYKPGKVVKVAIVESPNEVAAFISEIGVAAYFELNDGKIVRENIRSIPDISNVSATNRYISRYGGTPGFTFKQGSEPASPDVPVRRETMTGEQKREILKQRSTSFALPNLSPPDYIISRRTPPDLTRFESAVRSRLGDFYSPSCGEGEILIPYFSPTDPVVYVYADLGTCGKGIIGFFHKGRGQWTSGQFSPAKPPNQWSTTIQRIRENRAAAIRLPAKVN